MKEGWVWLMNCQLFSHVDPNLLLFFFLNKNKRSTCAPSLATLGEIHRTENKTPTRRPQNTAITTSSIKQIDTFLIIYTWNDPCSLLFPFLCTILSSGSPRKLFFPKGKWWQDFEFFLFYGYFISTALSSAWSRKKEKRLILWITLCCLNVDVIDKVTRRPGKNIQIV